MKFVQQGIIMWSTHAKHVNLLWMLIWAQPITGPPMRVQIPAIILWKWVITPESA